MKIFKIPVVLIAAAVMALNVSAASAQLAAIDKTTRGDWPGNYGADGYIIITGDPAHKKMPPYARITFEGDWGGELPQFWTWWDPAAGIGEYAADNSDAKRREPGVLFTGPDKASRVSACYFSGGFFTVNVDVGEEPKTVSLYMHDYDEHSRTANVYISDENGSRDLTDYVEVFGYEKGWYLKFQITGKVQFMIEDTSPNGMNAVLSGVFFDPGDPSLIVPSEEAPQEETEEKINEPNETKSVYDGEFFMAAALLAVIAAVLVMGGVSLVSGLLKK